MCSAPSVFYRSCRVLYYQTELTYYILQGYSRSIERHFLHSLTCLVIWDGLYSVHPVFNGMWSPPLCVALNLYSTVSHCQSSVCRVCCVIRLWWWTAMSTLRLVTGRRRGRGMEESNTSGKWTGISYFYHRNCLLHSTQFLAMLIALDFTLVRK